MSNKRIDLRSVPLWMRSLLRKYKFNLKSKQMTISVSNLGIQQHVRGWDGHVIREVVEKHFAYNFTDGTNHVTIEVRL